MKSVAEYANQLHELVAALQAEIQRIQADGILEYEEVLSGQKFYATHQNALKNLKKEVSLDIKQIRARYKGQILEAKKKYAGKDQTEAVDSLQLEQYNTLRPYEHVVQTVDRLLLGAVNDKQKLDQFAEEFKRFDVDAMPLKSVAEEARQTLATIEHHETISAEDLKQLLIKWKFLLEELDEKSAYHNLPVELAASFKGAKRALELAITDVSELVNNN